MSVSLLTAGCSRGPKPGTEIGWPPPPQKPKVVYVDAIYGSSNLKRSFFGAVKDFLFGKAAGQEIGKPYGVFRADNGKLYIAETARKGILVVDIEAGTIKAYNSMGVYGQLVEPVYVILDNDENIYVADTRLKKVVVFDKEFKFSHFIGVNGELEGPVGLAFDKTGELLYVVDTKLHMVKIFTRDGTLTDSIGRRGDEKGEFYHPLNVAINDGDTVYIVDSFHFAVQAFDSAGKFLFSFGPTAVGMGTLARPRDIAIDSDGHLYVTDAVRNNVQVFEADGTLLLRLGGGGQQLGQFRLPAGICIDDDDFIYISDSINGRIQILKYLGNG